MRLKIIQGCHSPAAVILVMARREVDGFVRSVGAPEGARRQLLVPRITDPLRPFVIVDCRIAKGVFGLVVGASDNARFANGVTCAG
jgi:hypothetical protein